MKPVLVVIGLILGGFPAAQAADEVPLGPGPAPEVVPIGPAGPPAKPTAAADPTWVLGEDEMAGADAVFGTGIPGGCEYCGGGQCVPPDWAIEQGIRVLARTRSKGMDLSKEFLNSYQLQQVPDNQTDVTLHKYTAKTVESTPVMVISTISSPMSVSPNWDAKLTRYLGRDERERDHFLDFEFWGLGGWNSTKTMRGILVPYYNESQQYTFAQVTTPGFTPAATQFTGNMLSPFPYVSATQVQNKLANADDYALSLGFNNADQHSFKYWSNANSWELNTRIAGRNQDDQFVLDSNGHWYRKCKPGLYYSYLFGLRAISLDEKAEFLSTGRSFDSNMNLLYTKSGRYVIRTANTLLGLQAGGSLEYRYCRWIFDTHGKVGPYINICNENSHIQTNTAGDPLATPNFDQRRETNNAVTAVVGEFGFGATHIFRPNWIGHVSYDFMFLGNLVLAPEQFQFATNPGPYLNTAGKSFWHGLTLGMEYNW